MLSTGLQQFPEMIRTTFQETIRPDDLAVLIETLPANIHDTHLEIRDTAQGVVARLAEHHELLETMVKEIRQQLRSPVIIQQHIESSLAGTEDGTTERDVSESRESSTGGNTANIVVSSLSLENISNPSSPKEKSACQETLLELGESSIRGEASATMAGLGQQMDNPSLSSVEIARITEAEKQSLAEV